MIPKVVNKRALPSDCTAENSIYIGRPTMWGNPFPITKTCTRKQSIAKFKAYFASSARLLTAVRTLARYKYLICFCAPQPCHGDVYIEYLRKIQKEM